MRREEPGNGTKVYNRTQLYQTRKASSALVILYNYLLDNVIMWNQGIHVRVYMYMYMYIGIGTALFKALLISESSLHMDCTELSMETDCQ